MISQIVDNSISYFKLETKKTSMFTLSGRRQDLLRLTIFPAVLNALSAGTDVAGIARYFEANCAKHGY